VVSGRQWSAGTGEDDGTDELLQHLVQARLAGAVATSPASTLANCGRLIAGDPRYTFGLSDWRDATLREAVDAVRSLCGGDPGGSESLDGDGYIDPVATRRAIEVHRRSLAETAAGGTARVLLATGHPTGLLGHYGAVARALQAAGCRLLVVLDDTTVRTGDDGRRRDLRFVDGVACVSDGGSLRHTHLPAYMEAMLDELDGHVDLVIADHGMAGAAVERGIRTLSIADVNDPALPLAQVRGRTDGVLPIDDNLAPRLFVPVTRAMLRWDGIRSPR
jgi:hypothetical protein